MTGDRVQGVQTSTQFISSPSPDFVTTDMNDVVHTVVECSRSYLSERKTLLTIEMCCEHSRILGSQERLTEVLNALLFRAERSIATAARTTGKIRIRTWATDGEVCCNLSDNGLGAGYGATITPDPYPSLTECAEIISDHGGRMYSWRPYTRGASYTIILPTI